MSILKMLAYPFKLFSFILLTVFGRIFYEQEKLQKANQERKITKTLILHRFVMELIVFFVTYFLLIEFLHFKENTNVAISVVISFLYVEVLDALVTLPNKLKDIILDKLGSNKYVIDPKEDDYPDGEG